MSPTDTKTLDEITADAPLDDDSIAVSSNTIAVGFNVLRLLIIVGAVLVFIMVVYMVATYPDAKSLGRLVGANGDKIGAFTDAKTAWFNQVKDLGQLFFVTPVFTLIGAVLGYMFGAKDTAPQGGD